MNVTMLEITQYQGVIDSLASLETGLIVLYGINLATLLIMLVAFNRRV